MKKNNWNYELLAKWCFGIGVFCLCILVIKLLFGGYVLTNKIDNEEIEITGQIGDFFGGVVGSIWALASVFLYFSALKMQSKELSNQIKEIDENRRISNKQQFETSFYSLMRTQQEIKNEIKDKFHDVMEFQNSFDVRHLEYTSGEFFKHAVSELKKLYFIYKRDKFQKWDHDRANNTLANFWHDSPNEPETDLIEYNSIFKSLNQDFTTNIYALKKETIKKAQAKDNDLFTCKCIYGHLFGMYENCLGHYCRHLYNIVKFVDTEYKRLIDECDRREFVNYSDRIKEIENINNQFNIYIGFIHSILSKSEMVVLFYNSLLFVNAQRLYVKWNLFENLRKESLIKKEHESLIPDIKLKSNKDIFEEILKEQ